MINIETYNCIQVQVFYAYFSTYLSSILNEQTLHLFVLILFFKFFIVILLLFSRILLLFFFLSMFLNVGMFSIHTGSVTSSDSGHSSNSSGDGTTLSHSYQLRCPSPPKHPPPLLVTGMYINSIRFRQIYLHYHISLIYLFQLPKSELKQCVSLHLPCLDWMYVSFKKSLLYNWIGLICFSFFWNAIRFCAIFCFFFVVVAKNNNKLFVCVNC